MADKTYNVSFGGVSIGDQTISIGIKFDRSAGTPNEIDKRFDGRRVSVMLAVIPKGVSPEQQNLEGYEDEPIVEADFDVKRFGTSPKNYTMKIACSIDSIDVAIFSRLSNRTGTMMVTESKAID